MTKLLIKLFINRNNRQLHADTASTGTREAYGKLAGGVGITTNSLLAIAKVIIGLISGSIAIIADGVNNLTDAASSIITLIGFRLASQKRDKEHPFGHSRIEYMTGMLISAIIILVGFELLQNSFEKVLHPEDVKMSIPSIFVLVIAIFVKLWQSTFNFTLGNIIDSSALKATATDSRNDYIATSAVLLSVLFTKFTGINIDGYIGLLVAAFIIYSGIQLIRETSDPLLGRAPTPQLVSSIEKLVMKGEGVLGMHDLIVHDYGPGETFASVHIEVDAQGDVLRNHEMIDLIEHAALARLGIELVAHMDPIDTANPIIRPLRTRMTSELCYLDAVNGLHDFRIVKGEENTNVIFDVVLTDEDEHTKSEVYDLALKVLDDVKKELQIPQTLSLVITFDLDYT
ncbi:MAG: cation diffusion facilitator family transporter [Clostridiales Family XIII bacterium]|jgi:cation diffusion facilitator family transporter|nr:cation diffusion facilitator family transporter [Clostridiales Family XIII bacterium]